MIYILLCTHCFDIALGNIAITSHITADLDGEVYMSMERVSAGVTTLFITVMLYGYSFRDSCGLVRKVK